MRLHRAPLWKHSQWVLTDMQQFEMHIHPVKSQPNPNQDSTWCVCPVGIKHLHTATRHNFTSVILVLWLWEVKIINLKLTSNWLSETNSVLRVNEEDKSRCLCVCMCRRWRSCLFRLQAGFFQNGPWGSTVARDHQTIDVVSHIHVPCESTFQCIHRNISRRRNGVSEIFLFSSGRPANLFGTGRKYTFF